MREKLVIFAGIALLIALAAGAMTLRVPAHSKAKIVEANVLMDTPGLYTTPSGKHTVHIWQVSEGQVKVQFCGAGEKSEERCCAGPTNPFQTDSEWFVCWDSRERLWAYFPDGDGLRIFYAGGGAVGSVTLDLPSSVYKPPSNFLNRLPDSVRIAAAP